MNLVMDAQSGECNTYVHFEAVYSLEDLYHPEKIENLQLKGKELNLRYLTSNMAGCGGLSEFLKKVRQYGLENEWRLKGNTRQRFGWVYDLMLPRGEYQEQTLKRLCLKFWHYVVGKETNLRYAAWTYEIPCEKPVKMIRIWIYDREYFIHKEKYQKDVWIDADGKVCGKHIPGAICKCRKGKVIPGRDAVYFKRTKSRLFEYKITGFEEKRRFYKTCWVQALRTVTNTTVIQGRYFPRLSIRNSYNRWLRRIIIAGNQARQTIQNEIMHWMRVIKSKSPSGFRDWVLDRNLGVQSVGGPGGEKMGILNELFDKYAAIFRNNRFTWKDDDYRLTGIRCDFAEQNCLKLLEMFRRDMENVLLQFELIEPEATV